MTFWDVLGSDLPFGCGRIGGEVATMCQLNAARNESCCERLAGVVYKLIGNWTERIALLILCQHICDHSSAIFAVVGDHVTRTNLAQS